jgi:cobalt/nickel transport system permease protein
MANFKFQILNCGAVLFIIFLFITLNSLLITAASAAKWSGVDETVVEKYAEEHGRPGKDPVINTDQGDLLLFMFLIGGLIGGFAAGYYWRMLTEQRNTTQYAKSLNNVKHGSNNGSK